ncbi:MAG: betaine--homocysteine S-methyltransferase [Alphaproteobacteria bacterium]|nr:betaine--homocysteine S-methyltransferase [Alphaproteobacteria bacterium]
MTDRIRDLLDEKGLLLADGATGTNLFARGLVSGEAPELWNIDRPDEVKALHQGFVDAGSDIILTNTFGGNRHRLKLHGAEDRMAELNAVAVTLARAVADGAGRPVVVAGSMGPTGELIQPLGALSPEDARDAYAEQAAALAAAGVDVLWIETLSAAEELSAAITGAAVAGLPTVCTMTFDSAGRTMMGLLPNAYARLCGELQPPPFAYGANCGVGAPELLHTLLGMKSAADADDILIAKANCGIPQYVDGALVYSGTVEIMADYARLARDIGARIIGGCCGTTATHVQAMRAALDHGPAGLVPDLTQISARMGTPWAGLAIAEGGDNAAPRPRRRSRRRAD